MKRTWKFNYEFKVDGGESSGSWDIKAWTPSDAVREIADILRKTAKDERAKRLTSLSITLAERGRG